MCVLILGFTIVSIIGSATRQEQVKGGANAKERKRKAYTIQHSLHVYICFDTIQPYSRFPPPLPIPHTTPPTAPLRRPHHRRSRGRGSNSTLRRLGHAHVAGQAAAQHPVAQEQEGGHGADKCWWAGKNKFIIGSKTIKDKSKRVFKGASNRCCCGGGGGGGEPEPHLDECEVSAGLVSSSSFLYMVRPHNIEVVVVDRWHLSS